MTWKGWLPLSLALNLVALTFIFAIVSDYHFVDPAVLASIRAQDHLDVVQVASQFGRFDLVSLLLTVFGLMVVFGGLFAFGYVRGQTYAIARSSAEDVAERRLTELLKEFRDSVEAMRQYGSTQDRPTAPPPTGDIEKAGADTETTEFDGKEDDKR